MDSFCPNYIMTIVIKLRILLKAIKYGEIRRGNELKAEPPAQLREALFDEFNTEGIMDLPVVERACGIGNALVKGKEAKYEDWDCETGQNN